jgi:hypothetical protein
MPASRNWPSLSARTPWPSTPSRRTCAATPASIDMDGWKHGVPSARSTVPCSAPPPTAISISFGVTSGSAGPNRTGSAVQVRWSPLPDAQTKKSPAWRLATENRPASSETATGCSIRRRFPAFSRKTFTPGRNTDASPWRAITRPMTRPTTPPFSNAVKRRFLPIRPRMVWQPASSLARKAMGPLSPAHPASVAARRAPFPVDSTVTGDSEQPLRTTTARADPSTSFGAASKTTSSFLPSAAPRSGLPFTT